MLEPILAPRRRAVTDVGSTFLASVAFHALVVAAVALVVAGAASRDTPATTERAAMLMLPLFPASAPPQQTTLTWRGGTSPGDGLPADLLGAGTGVGDDIGSGRRAVEVVPGAEPGPPEGGGNDWVYAFDEDLDRPVSRNALAGAPRYPPALLAARVEGWVMGEFTVDTTGHADSLSLVVIEATHPAFEESLREALPRLRYVPAEHGGRLVRQRVAQKFVFRIELPETTATGT